MSIRHPERPRWRDRTIGCAIFRGHAGCSRDDCHCPCHFLYPDAAPEEADPA